MILIEWLTAQQGNGFFWWWIGVPLKLFLRLAAAHCGKPMAFRPPTLFFVLRLRLRKRSYQTTPERLSLSALCCGRAAVDPSDRMFSLNSPDVASGDGNGYSGDTHRSNTFLSLFR